MIVSRGEDRWSKHLDGVVAKVGSEGIWVVQMRDGRHIVTVAGNTWMKDAQDTGENKLLQVFLAGRKEKRSYVGMYAYSALGDS